MDEVIAEVKKYAGAFAKCELLIEQRGETLNVMRDKARQALTECEAIRTDQKNQLTQSRNDLAQKLQKLGKRPGCRKGQAGGGIPGLHG